MKPVIPQSIYAVVTLISIAFRIILLKAHNDGTFQAPRLFHRLLTTKTNQLIISTDHRSKLCLRAKLLGNYFITPNVHVAFWGFNTVFAICGYLALKDKRMEYTLLPILCALLGVALSLWYVVTAIFVCVTYFYLETTYYKYAFRDLNKRILADKYLNTIENIIRFHNRLDKQMKMVNQTSSKMIAVAYFCGTPLMEFFIYVSKYDGVPIMYRILNTIMACLSVFILYIITYTSAKLSYEAHLPYKYLNKMMAKNLIQTNLWRLAIKTVGASSVPQKIKNFKLKLKILIFIERLAGPTIGIYCLHLFPFTNFGFFNLFLPAVTLFFLLLGIS